MRKKINGIITAICFLCLLIGGAGVDGEHMALALILAIGGFIGVMIEGIYWRGIYER